jgi:hypothetical protein
MKETIESQTSSLKTAIQDKREDVQEKKSYPSRQKIFRRG